METVTQTPNMAPVIDHFRQMATIPTVGTAYRTAARLLAETSPTAAMDELMRLHAMTDPSVRSHLAYRNAAERIQTELRSA